ncbi:histidine kinase [Streptomyces sp. NPDC054796]
MRTLVLLLAVCAAPATMAVTSHGQEAVTAAMSVPLLAVAAKVYGRWPLAATAVPVAMGLATNVELLAPAYWPALVLFGFLAGRRMPSGRPALGFFGGVAAVGLPLCAFVERELWAWPTQLLALLLAVVMPWLLGRYRRQYAELTSTGWQLAEQLEHQQRAAAERARLRERARIAGDMHDSLGHDLTLLAIRAGALQVDPALGTRQRAAAAELREAAAAATERLRDIVGVLRAEDDGEHAAGSPEEPAAGRPEESVEDLVRGACDAGLTVTLEGGHEARALTGTAARAAHRVVQESLTNAAKHAPGAEVRVRVRARVTGGADARVVTVTNGPAPDRRSAEPHRPSAAHTATPLTVVSGGAGLVGLDERVRLAGGTLGAGGTAEGGFEVTAELPVDGAMLAGGELPAGGEDTALAATTRRHPRGAPTASSRELERVRRRVRRSLAHTVLAPPAAVAGIVLLMAPVGLVSSSLSVLERADYEQLRPGTSRAAVEARMPMFTRDDPPDDAPPVPRGQRCVYYSTGLNSSDAYRLCFADGVLATASRVGRAAR